MDTLMRKSALRGLSIQQRVPLLICILLICVMVTFSWISYIGVKKASMKSGYDRLSTLTDQLSNMMALSTQNYIAATRTTAASPEIIKCLQNLEPQTCTETLVLLEKARQDSAIVLVQLLDARLREVLHSSRKAIETRVNFDSLNAFHFTKDTGSVSKFYQVKDSIYYAITVPIKDNRSVLGYIVKWRSINATPEALERFSQLLGAKAKLYFGNLDRSLWTDMIKPINSPIPEKAGHHSDMYE